jgi:CPA2 family monovalent cation:H+ antiporter-2
MVALLPAFADFSPQALPAVGLALVKTAVFLGGALLLALRGIPAILERVARANAPELFLLTVLCVCLAAGASAHMMGFSLALGAFIAGIIVSESDYAVEVFRQVSPLRDVFASLFFVSIGMLLSPRFVSEHWLAVLVVVLAIVGGKLLLLAIPIYLLGWHGRTALLAGVGLAQIGEFSFVLAKLGTGMKLISEEIAGVILASALVTLFLAPFLYNSAGWLYDSLNAHPALSRLLNRVGGRQAPKPLLEDEEEVPEVIVLGYGRVGQHVSHALLAHGVPHLVVEYDATRVARLRTAWIPVLYGDASSEAVLAQVGPHRAAIAVVALPEASTTERAVRILRRLAPEITIVARIHREEEILRLREAGADQVIYAEFETGAGIIRETLLHLGMSEREVDGYIASVRTRRHLELEQTANE